MANRIRLGAIVEPTWRQPNAAVVEKKVGQCLFPLFKHSELLQVCLHREVVNYIFLFQVERDINKLFAAKGSENMGTQISSRDPSSQKNFFFRKLRNKNFFVHSRNF